MIKIKYTRDQARHIYFYLLLLRDTIYLPDFIDNRKIEILEDIIMELEVFLGIEDLT